jgi:prevent-host-death family protein
MRAVTVREARAGLRALLELAQRGEEIVILRRGKEVARLVPPRQKPAAFPDLTEFRASIAVAGEPLSQTVVDQRRDTRY